MNVNSYSIIIPSFNQERFIKETLENVTLLKEEAAKKNIRIQVILIDNCSEKNTRTIIENYRSQLDIIIIESDKGQYDAINKGVKLVKGTYWTWLNTDDLIDHEGFFCLTEYLSKNPDTDYIYGDITYIDENSSIIKKSSSEILSLTKLVNEDASISQPGSFFKTEFTRKIGELAPYHFAFDYEYILRCFKNNAIVKKTDATVSFFRYYTSSKSGSKDFRFLSEQLKINKLYGGAPFSKLRMMLQLRILKRKLFN